MKRTKFMVQSGVFAALYVVLTYAQNLIWPGSTTMAIQFRLSEAMCIMALFTPAAIPGLTLGCLLYNVSWTQSLPLDWVVGTLATLLATTFMWLLRRVKVMKLPLPALLMPAICNAPLVGWELALFLGDAGFTWPLFFMNCLYVFIGEAVVLLVLGTILYLAITKRNLDRKLFL